MKKWLFSVYEIQQLSKKEDRNSFEKFRGTYSISLVIATYEEINKIFEIKMPFSRIWNTWKGKNNLNETGTAGEQKNQKNF